MPSPPRIIAEATFSKSDAAHDAVTHSFVGDDGTAANRVMIVAAAAATTGNRYQDTLSFGTTTLTRLRRITAGSDNETVALWHAAAPDSGTNDLAFTMTGDVDVSYARAWILENAEQITPESISAVSSGTTALTGTLATVSDNDLILALFAWEAGAGALSEPAGFLEDDEQEITSSGENLGVHVLREVDASSGTNVGVTSTATNSSGAAGVIVALGTGGAVLLDGDGASESDGTGSLAVQRDIAGTGASETDGAGDLALTREIAGTGATDTAGAGDLALTRELAGTGAAATSGAGGLAVTRAFSGTGDCESNASSRLEIVRGLVANGDIIVDANAALDVLRPMTGTGSTITNGTGFIGSSVLTPSVILRGAAPENISLAGSAAKIISLAGSASKIITLEGVFR